MFYESEMWVGLGLQQDFIIIGQRETKAKEKIDGIPMMALLFDT